MISGAIHRAWITWLGWRNGTSSAITPQQSKRQKQKQYRRQIKFHSINSINKNMV